MNAWKTLEQNASESEILRGLIDEADAVVVGIGAGMSAADGFTYIGDRFKNNFPDFIEKYNWFDMLQASLFKFPTLEEYWAFQSRFIVLNYLDQPAGEAYIALKEMIEKKPYHVITTNADNAFYAADYNMDKVLYYQASTPGCSARISVTMKRTVMMSCCVKWQRSSRTWKSRRNLYHTVRNAVRRWKRISAQQKRAWSKMRNSMHSETTTMHSYKSIRKAK